MGQVDFLVFGIFEIFWIILKLFLVESSQSSENFSI